MYGIDEDEKELSNKISFYRNALITCAECIEFPFLLQLVRQEKLRKIVNKISESGDLSKLRTKAYKALEDGKRGSISSNGIKKELERYNSYNRTLFDSEVSYIASNMDKNPVSCFKDLLNEYIRLNEKYKKIVDRKNKAIDMEEEAKKRAEEAEKRAEEAKKRAEEEAKRKADSAKRYTSKSSNQKTKSSTSSSYTSTYSLKDDILKLIEKITQKGESLSRLEILKLVDKVKSNDVIVASNIVDLEELIKNALETLKIEKRVKKDVEDFSAYDYANITYGIYQNRVEYLLMEDKSRRALSQNDVLGELNIGHELEAYKEIYKKFQKHYEKLDEEEKASFDKHYYNTLGRYLEVPNSKKGGMLHPSDLEKIILERVRKELLEKFKHCSAAELFSASSDIRFMLRVFSATEIAQIYKELTKDKDYLKEDAQHIFALAIEEKMTSLDDIKDLSDKEKEQEKNRRIVSICRDFFFEDPIYNYGVDVETISEDYAKERVNTGELISKQKKIYFGMDKVQRMLKKMDYKYLTKMSKKDVLSKEEEERVRRMF